MMIGSERIGVVHYGLGPIGLAAAAVVSRRTEFVSVAAVDTDPELQGRDLGELLGLGPIGVIVSSGADVDFGGARVAIHCTGSSLARVAPQLQRLIERGVHVVSSCEELSFAWAQDAITAARLDATAKRAGVVVVGTGINPGFVMDSLPLALC